MFDPEKKHPYFRQNEVGLFSLFKFPRVFEIEMGTVHSKKERLGLMATKVATLAGSPLHFVDLRHLTNMLSDKLTKISYAMPLLKHDEPNDHQIDPIAIPLRFRAISG